MTKIQVDSNGKAIMLGGKALVASEGGVTPTGTISITANGTYDVTNYASADVSVSGSDNIVTYSNGSSTIQINFTNMSASYDGLRLGVPILFNGESPYNFDDMLMFYGASLWDLSNSNSSVFIVFAPKISTDVTQPTQWDLSQFTFYDSGNTETYTRIN